MMAVSTIIYTIEGNYIITENGPLPLACDIGSFSAALVAGPGAIYGNYIGYTV